MCVSVFLLVFGIYLGFGRGPSCSLSKSGADARYATASYLANNAKTAALLQPAAVHQLARRSINLVSSTSAREEGAAAAAAGSGVPRARVES